jgi:hypothetical protein
MSNSFFKNEIFFAPVLRALGDIIPIRIKEGSMLQTLLEAYRIVNTGVFAEVGYHSITHAHVKFDGARVFHAGLKPQGAVSAFARLVFEIKQYRRTDAFAFVSRVHALYLCDFLTHRPERPAAKRAAVFAARDNEQ